MAIEIRSGPARVITAGEVTTFGGQPLEIRIELPDREVWYRVQLAFRGDPAVADVAVDTIQLDDGLRFDLVNFDTADGRGSARPVLLADLGEELLFLHFRVFRFGRTDDRTVHYTFYLAAKADVGWTAS